MYELFARGRFVVVSVCVCAEKLKSQQHSRACPRTRVIYNACSICRLSRGRLEVVHYRTYSTAVHVLRQ